MERTTAGGGSRLPLTTARRKNQAKTSTAGGTEDPFFDCEIDEDGYRRTPIEDWQRQTRGRFASFLLPGDHSFLVKEHVVLLSYGFLLKYRTPLLMYGSSLCAFI